MTGYGVDEILGTAMPYPFWPDEEIEKLQKLYFTPIEEGQTHRVAFRRKNGERFTALVSPSVVTNELGEMVSFFAIIKDISAISVGNKRERMLSLVADKTTDAVIVAGHDYRIIWVNDAFSKLTGYSLQEIQGKVPGRFLQGPKTSAKTRKVIREHLRRRESVAVEILNYAKDGTEYWLDLNINPVFDENGELELFIAVERDVTTKKRAEQALQLANDQLEEIQEIAKIGYWELEYETGRLNMSEVCYEIFGVDKKTYNGTIRGLMKYVHTDDSKMVRNAMNDALDSGFYDLVYRVKRSDDQVRFVQERGVVISDPMNGGKILRGTVQDIDGSVRARMERETMSEIRQVIDTSPVVHFKLVMMPDGNIRFAYVSESIEKIDPRLNAALLMRGRQNPIYIVGRTQFELVIKELTSSAEKDSPMQMELLVDNEKGQRHIELYAEPEVSIDGKLVWYGHLQDVPATYQRNLELERLVSITESQNQRLLDFAQVLSHNVRLHSSTMDGLIMAIDESSDPDELELYHRYLRETSEKLDDTLRDLNTVLTIRSGAERKLEAVDVASLLENGKTEWASRCELAGGKLDFKVPSKLEAVTSKKVLISILDELIDNAIRFRSVDRPLRVEVSASIDYSKRSLEIRVSDNGIGINQELVKENMFGMYRTFHEGISGKGIGLFLAKNRAEAIEGDLALTKFKKHGVCFTLTCRM